MVEQDAKAAAARLETSGDEPQGPLVWRNWQALLIGQPARINSHSSSGAIVPSWEEWGLYSDARLIGELGLGPYELMLAFPPLDPRLGFAQLTVVARSVDHLLDADGHLRELEEVDIESYAGGDLGDQLAALLSLALDRRVRCGGVLRHALDGDLAGRPMLASHHPPALGPPSRRPVLPSVAGEAKLEDAAPYLRAYAALSASQAVVLQRAANLFGDALWWADADPRVAWIKLSGAVETAANLWAGDRSVDPVQILKRRRGRLYGELKKTAPDALEIVARHLSFTLGAQAKMVEFLLAHHPGSPPIRPQFGWAPWDELEQALDVLYDHRSRDLHDGIPFPAPLCEGPISDSEGVAAERFPGLGAEQAGGRWTAKSLPMYLHTFAYLTGGALRRWWLELADAAPGHATDAAPADARAEPVPDRQVGA
ncbi:hypothetical protein [Baekduia sp. Peel2402]|uniref:hypothetical protein n=1 Tax=Baekduia sp. Peel2402 TaxID=3458296 RepID=UPI00403EF573